jgi:hypothetical protein
VSCAHSDVSQSGAGQSALYIYVYIICIYIYICTYIYIYIHKFTGRLIKPYVQVELKVWGDWVS